MNEKIMRFTSKTSAVLASLALCLTSHQALAQTSNQTPAPVCSGLSATIGDTPVSPFKPGETCTGFDSGNTEKVPYELLGYDWAFAYKDNNGVVGSTAEASNLFDGWANGDNAVAINFEVGVNGPAMVGLKIGDSVGYYLFGNGFQMGDTLRFTWNPGWTGDGLSHTTLYTMAPIPEPETYALMLAGLGAVSFVARRRKARSN